MTDPFDLSGKVALVTGASRGLGEGMTLALAQAGANCKPAAEYTEADWDQVLDVNLKGAFFTTLAVGGGMLRRKSGRIINICSLTSAIGIRNIPAYAASKGGSSR